MRELLQAAYLDRERELAEHHSRSLPFQDALFDRWDRARRLGFGEGASIYNSAVVLGDVRVGEGTWVGPFCMLDGSGGGLEVGAYCSVAAGVHLYTHDTIAWALTGGRAKPRQASVRIGDCCYLGSQSVVAAGVVVGSHCVIASNSFVNTPVPDYTVVGGSPARRLGHVEVDGEDVRLVYE